MPPPVVLMINLDFVILSKHPKTKRIPQAFIGMFMTGNPVANPITYTIKKQNWISSRKIIRLKSYRANITPNIKKCNCRGLGN